MSRPVREKLAQAGLAIAGNGSPAISNAGLALDRYIDWEIQKQAGQPETRRSRAFSQICAAGCPSIYNNAYTRWLHFLNERGPAVKKDWFQVVTRMIVGLGGESVHETGITLMHAYGMPIIPGSALKGLARHYATTVLLPAKKLNEEQIRVLFGNTSAASYLIFHDAWYVPKKDEKPLVQDIMTVHHPRYYTDQSGTSPGPWDFDDPNPVGYISAQGTYLVAVEGPWAEYTLRLLELALVEWGIGAKTSSGYGRLKRMIASAENNAPESVTTDMPDSTISTVHTGAMDAQQALVERRDPLLAQVESEEWVQMLKLLLVRWKQLDDGDTKLAIARAFEAKLKQLGVSKRESRDFEPISTYLKSHRE